MKNLKKLVSVIVTLAMLISSLAVVGVSADYNDVNAENSYYKAINVLSGLDVIKGDDEGNFNPTNDIKRSEMIALVCRAVGEEEIAIASGAANFDDVPANHWATSYIAWGVASGIVKGVGDNNFAPDASVTFQDAIVMILRALGYERIAIRDDNGGYPTGYMKVAGQKGVLADASTYAGGKAATREIIAQVLYNAMSTPLVDVSYYAPKPEDDEYVVFDGKKAAAPLSTLLLTEKVYKIKAEVTATAKASTDLRDDDGNHKVELKYLSDYADTVTYKESVKTILGVDGDDKFKPFVGETDIADYLGYTVEAYIAENEDLDGFEVIAVVADAKSVKELTISSADVEFTGYTANSLFTYEDANGKEVEIDLDTVTFYYNGNEIAAGDIGELEDAVVGTDPGDDIEKLLVEKANILKFVGPRTGDYNKIFITNYDYKKVKEVFVEELEIVCDDETVICLDPEVREDLVYGLYDAEGNAIAIEDIKENDILNIVAPLYDAEPLEVNLDEVDYMEIYVTDTVVSGSVDEVDAEYYTIAGEKYKSIDPLTAGQAGDFYITIDGLVLDCDTTSVASKDIAFLVDAWTDTRSDGTVKGHFATIYTAEGELETYEFASKVKVGDTSKEKGALKTYVDSLETLSENKATEELAVATFRNRIFTYKLNASDEIKEITFIAPEETANSGAPKAYGYKPALNKFANTKLDDSSKLFVTVADELDTDAWNIDEDELAIAAFASLSKDDTYSANTYMLDGIETLGAALIYEDIEAKYDGVHFAVVVNKSTVLDSEQDTIDKYTFIQSGETLALTVDKYEDLAELAIGDVFRYTVNAAGDIDSIEVVYDFSEETVIGDYSYTPGSEDYAIEAGKIFDIEDGAAIIDVNGDTTEEGANSSDDLELVIGSADGRTVVTIDYADGSLKASDIEVVRNLKASTSRKTYTAIISINEAEEIEDCVMIITNA